LGVGGGVLLLIIITVTIICIKKRRNRLRVKPSSSNANLNRPTTIDDERMDILKGEMKGEMMTEINFIKNDLSLVHGELTYLKTEVESLKSRMNL